MSTLNVQIDSFDDFLADVHEAGIQAEPLVKAALQNSATQVQRNVRDRAPHRTGTLQRSVLTQVKFPAAIISVDEKYGAFIEDGTRPHVIMPRNKKALFWNGAFSPVKSVNHPGTKARPFFKPGVDATDPYIDSQFLKVVERLIGIMAGKS